MATTLTSRTRTQRMTDDVLWSRIDKSGDCWEWTGPKDRKGYGRAGRRGSAHRVVYELVVGPIPDNLQLDHLCRNHGCCRPDHCEPVPCRENLMRGKTLAAANAAKTHCSRGHEYTTENTEEYRGRRKCRTCRAAESRAAYLKRRGGDDDSTSAPT